jgi:hypothetical protein
MNAPASQQAVVSGAQKLSTDAEEVLHQDGREALQVGSRL